ncbi:hypothetical protein H2204_007437 [Knufia peltigerae]|uniref:NACHT domain-containing protein n=1 Tax=Knufia peltigerae TaxID=1002370 RepID=A0AA39CVQ5_9EURO|nr:hypothetical protein H2204_007437 [Knufia peltigerae]
MASLRDQAHPIIKEAFTNFESLVRVNDARMFKSTTLADVREAARIIERDQSQRRCLRNMRRIEPLFDALHKLGGAIETLCSGTPYLCFIWVCGMLPIFGHGLRYHQKAPIKLVLHIADEHTSAFDQLIDAYRQIAQNLPRFGRLGTALCDQDDFQVVLAEIYSDILEFHTHAYQYLRRGGWKCLFDASWRSFSRRFNSILQRLSRGRDLIDKEAQAFDLLEVKAFRQQVLDELDRSEHERQHWQLRDTLSWLDLKGQDREQDDLFECRSSARKPGTCEWILDNAKIRSWLDPEDGRPQLWLRGKPGSGKTTLITYLYENAQIPPESIMLYCLCAYGFARSEANACGLTYRSLIAQLVRKGRNLVSYVYNNFAKTGVVLSASRARDLLKSLLQASGPAFLIFDGLDECEGIHQRQLLSELRQLLVSVKPSSEDQSPVKILISCRETKEAWANLKKVPRLVLMEEKDKVSKDIAKLAKVALSPLRDRFKATVIAEVEQGVVEKADGKTPPPPPAPVDVTESKIQFSITQVCLRYLMTCQPFSVEPLTHQTRADIVKGFHDIFPYINQFWTNHLVECLRAEPTTISEEDGCAKKEIHQLLVDLLQSFQINGYDGSNQVDGSPSVTGPMYRQVLTLEDLPRPVLHHLDSKKRKQATRDGANANTLLGKPPRQGLWDDPMLLNIAFSRFQDCFESLLDDQSSELANELGVSLPDLLSFRARHSHAAYLCHRRGCVRASIGFQSSEERSRHETCHEERFRCSDPSCDFSVRGFASWSALQKHVKTYHTSLDDIVLKPFPGSEAIARYRGLGSRESHSYNDNGQEYGRNITPNFDSPQENSSRHHHDPEDTYLEKYFQLNNPSQYPKGTTPDWYKRYTGVSRVSEEQVPNMWVHYPPNVRHTNFNETDSFSLPGLWPRTAVYPYTRAASPINESMPIDDPLNISSDFNVPKWHMVEIISDPMAGSYDPEDGA